jgi:hypothetical protein
VRRSKSRRFWRTLSLAGCLTLIFGSGKDSSLSLSAWAYLGART